MRKLIAWVRTWAEAIAGSETAPKISAAVKSFICISSYGVGRWIEKDGSSSAMVASMARTAFLSILPTLVRGSADTPRDRVDLCEAADLSAFDRGAKRRADVVKRRRPARHGHDDRQGPLLPFRIGHADDRDLCHIVGAHDQILEGQRTDPLSPGLDHILDAIANLNGTVPADRRDILSVQPTPVPQLRGGCFIAQ